MDDPAFRSRSTIAQVTDVKPVTDALPVVEPARYEREGEVGHGGIGTVQRARDTRLGRTVAIKELLEPGGEARFIREALVTARLEHPGIVPVHDAGRWPTGEPFYAMKLVEGQTLAALIKKADGPAGRLALVPNILAVAEALGYAHSRGVIHRDVKPHNVIVGEFGETVLIDWGLARGASDDSPEPIAPPLADAEATVAGDVVGTPAYMSPEQARAEALGPETDVYSVGVMLYQVISGKMPHRTLTGDISKLIAAIARGEVTPLEEIVRDVPADLLVIVRKAMASDRTARYPTAAELADDLRRFTTGKLVSARVYTTWDLVRRWLGRHRALVAVIAGALLTVAAVGVVALHRVVAARRVAEAQRRKAEAKNQRLILTEARRSLADDPTMAIAWLKTYPPGAPHQDDALQIADDARSRGVARRIFEVYADNVELTPDGRWILYRDDHSTLFARPADGGADVKLATGTPWFDLARDGKTLLADVVTDDAHAQWEAWDLAGGTFGTPRVIGPNTENLEMLVASPDGKRLAIVTHDGVLKVVDGATGASRTLGENLSLAYAPSFTPDGARLLGLTGPDLGIWDVATGAYRLVRKLEAPVAFELSPDGDTIAVARQPLTLYSLAAGASDPGRELTAPGAQGSSARVHFAPDGKLVMTAGADTIGRVWHVEGGPPRVLRGHHAEIYSFGITSEGTAVTSDSASIVRVWRLPPDGHVERVIPGGVKEARLSHDGKLVAAGMADGHVLVWDRATGAARTFPGHAGRVTRVAFSPDDRYVGSVSLDGTARIVDLSTGEARLMGPTGSDASITVVFASSGRWAVFGGHNDLAGVNSYDVAAGRVICQHAVGMDWVVAPTPDDKIVLSDDRDVILLDPATCAVTKLQHHDGTVTGIAPSADGRWIVSGGNDHQVIAWDRAAGAAVPIGKQPSEVLLVSASPDGKWAASTGYDGTVHLWDLDGRRERAVLGGFEGLTFSSAFTPDGRALAATGEDDTLRLWDLATLRGKVLRGHAMRVELVVPTPDGRELLSGALDGTVRSWAVNLDDLPTGGVTRAWLDELTGAEVSEADR
jgi:WD40 repeat protein/tRNA A-37 threonylcarbamoyl transferase component Bud32